jgi:hypothetical protein
MFTPVVAGTTVTAPLAPEIGPTGGVAADTEAAIVVSPAPTTPSVAQDEELFALFAIDTVVADVFPG